MYYVNTRMLYPSGASLLTPEHRLPTDAVLSGLAWDYTDATLITYDRTEKKLMWIQSANGALVASAVVDTPVDEVIGMASFKDQLYILTNELDDKGKNVGKLAVYTGVISSARANSVMYVSKHDVPYSTANPSGSTSLYARTHAVPPQYLRYHPDFCNIFTIGSAVYLLIGVADTINPNTVPSNLGQYVVEYDLNGVFRSQVSIDPSPAPTSSSSRPRTINSYNGTAVAATYHDGMLVLMCREIDSVDHPSIIHALKYANSKVSSVDKFWYLVGSIVPYGDLLVRGRYAYTLIGNRITKSDVIMITLDMDSGWPSTSLVDLGNLASGQTVYRKLRCKNVSPVSTYKELTVHSNDPNLLLSVADNPTISDYSTAITIPQTLAPNATFTFWVCLTSPIIRNEEYAPYQYYNKLIFSPKIKEDYA